MFARRVHRALEWRWHRMWDSIGHSDARRALDCRTVWARRSLGFRRGPLVLRFANPYRSRPPELEWFSEDVDRVSAGALRISFVDSWTTADNRHEETATVAAVIRNHADLAWAGTRAFGCFGVRSLDPLQTPFLLEDYAVLDAVCRDHVISAMLEPLTRLGLVGLVVLPGAQRKPFAFTRRLLGPDDYEGAKMRTHESLVAASTYHAVGAEAVTLSARQMASGPEALIDGLDIQTEALAGWRLRGSITFNVNLWPRTLALVASQTTYEWLEAAEREILQVAAEATLRRALSRLADQERRDQEALPPSVTPIYAHDDDVIALRERVEPVREELRRNPKTRHVLERLEVLAGHLGVLA
jgi:TRAP-type C4-dicarboxylate transport system substrate-binding protein